MESINIFNAFGFHPNYLSINIGQKDSCDWMFETQHGPGGTGS